MDVVLSIEKNILTQVEDMIQSIAETNLLSEQEIIAAQRDYERYDHVILSQGLEKIKVLVVGTDNENTDIEICFEEDILFPTSKGKPTEWDTESLIALYVIRANISLDSLSEGKKYTREGMRKRVLDERKSRAAKAEYKVKLADNIHGEHTLYNEKGMEYKITLHDFEKETGYINNIDWKTNKLGTTKHIMYLYEYMKENPAKVKRLKKNYPFIEIYTDPLNDYKISWLFPDEMKADEKEIINEYFGNNTCIEDSKMASFFSFISKTSAFERIKIREEVFDKIEAYFEDKELQEIERNTKLDYSVINAELYPYQKEGVQFSTFKKGVIIADEMGLGKTIQAIATAVLKKNIFGFKRTLVICPASVKHQWKKEILKFSNEKATIIEGFPQEREKMYLENQDFFHIINYETVLRDLRNINKANYDFVILDEAQKIKNYETKTSSAIKSIRKNHALIITGTPIENKLLDLYSIVQFLDQKFLAPQWEFSFQHCIFDSNKKNKIQGYYNLQQLKNRLSGILLRREKKEVFKELPNVVQKNIFVSLSDEQANLHASFSRGIAKILGKKFKTTFDWQRLMHLLTNMRMVCDSSYLIDKETHFSPKLIELKEILLEKLDLKNQSRKIIIFSEWVVMLQLIGDMLKKEGLTYTMLTGKVPVKKRGALIKEFEENPDCKIFLSSEAGGAGLNLQMADTVINFELPWNPAKKNQRIGRIDRIGQKKDTLLVFNLLSHNSIEMKIATGLVLKQNLFDGVLNNDNATDEVDFSEKGKSQFLRQLEEVISDEISDTSAMNTPQEDVQTETEQEELLEITTAAAQNTPSTSSEEQAHDVTSEEKNRSSSTEQPSSEIGQKTKPNFKEMEEVMTKGMEFLTGIYKMSTGNDLTDNGKPKVNVNEETGEVSITFKMDF